MVHVKLLRPFAYHHNEIPIGIVIGLPADLARRLVALEMAEMAEPERTVIEPSEVRSDSGYISESPGYISESPTGSAIMPRRRGRPPKRIKEEETI